MHWRQWINTVGLVWKSVITQLEGYTNFCNINPFSNWQTRRDSQIVVAMFLVSLINIIYKQNILVLHIGHCGPYWSNPIHFPLRKVTPKFRMLRLHSQWQNLSWNIYFPNPILMSLNLCILQIWYHTTWKNINMQIKAI